jgi:hypothetical protein
MSSCWENCDESLLWTDAQTDGHTDGHTDAQG